MQMTGEIKKSLQDLEDLLNVQSKVGVKDEDRKIYQEAWEFLDFFRDSRSYALGAINFIAEKSSYYIRKIKSIRT